MTIYQTTIIEQKQIAKNTLEVSFRRPNDFFFKAGQYIQLGVPKLLYSDVKGSSRVFSIASSPFDQEKISIAFRDTGSGFKRTLKELPINASVNIEGPHGFFTIPQNSSHSHVFIAGGIGITPYLSMLRFIAERGFTFPVMLLYTNRNKERAAYLKELQDTAKCNKYFIFKNRYGRIDKQFIQQSVKNIQRCSWRIGGPPAMVSYVKNILFLLGIDGRLIYSEEFTGYE